MRKIIAYLLATVMLLSHIPAIPAGADSSLSTKLLAEYNFDDETTNDSVGSNHAVFYDNATAAQAGFADGISGKALQLSTQGTEEKYWLSVPYSALQTSKDSFTISLWYNSTGHNTSGENSELFSLYNSGVEKFLFYGVHTDGSYGYANVLTPYVQNQWTHLVNVECSDINPQQYSEMITVTASDGNETLYVSYSPMNYIVRMYNGSASQSLKTLLKALYNYHLEAGAYLN